MPKFRPRMRQEPRWVTAKAGAARAGRGLREIHPWPVYGPVSGAAGKEAGSTGCSHRGEKL